LRRIAGSAGIAVETAATYLEACESAYLLFSCPLFTFSERKRAARNKKFYPVDTGLRRCIVTKTGSDLGRMLENAVFVALRRTGHRVCYWREKGEVDFVVQTSGRIIPIQVSWTPPVERHHSALEQFYEQFPNADEAMFIGPKEYEEGLTVGPAS
jgi:predicted AAA+ superfamily ATPase